MGRWVTSAGGLQHDMGPGGERRREVKGPAVGWGLVSRLSKCGWMPTYRWAVGRDGDDGPAGHKRLKGPPAGSKAASHGKHETLLPVADNSCKTTVMPPRVPCCHDRT